MTAIRLDVKTKALFFDRKAVQAAVGKKTAAALGKAGAYVRRSAQSSLRRRKKPSRPGSPPSVHSSDAVATLKNILFAFEPNRQSVVVGPVLLNARTSAAVPGVHELGGSMVVREKLVGRQWRSQGRRKPRPGQPTRARRITYPKRPFMVPALKREAPKFPSLWLGLA